MNGITSDSVRASQGQSALDGARFIKNSGQTITDSTWTAITFDGLIFQSGAYHDGANPTRFTITTAGYYLIGGQVEFAANSTGIRYTRITTVNISGTFDLAFSQVPVELANARSAVTMSSLWTFQPGDFNELMVYQTSGGNLNIVSIAWSSPIFWITKIAS